MEHIFYILSLMGRDLIRVFLGVGEPSETARLSAKERKELGLPY